MPCYRPLQAWRGKTCGVSGKRSVVFKRAESAPALVAFPLKLPCGQCVGCRLERSRQWALRCVAEASLYSDNCFITLTFDDAHLPPSGSLDVRHFQLFMKRLRKAAGRPGIRFFHCGEYGEQFGRPHYHACLFNYDFPDKILFRVTDRGDRVYTSEFLRSVWPFGHSMIGSVTFESAAYVARYVMKKVTGAAAVSHYVVKATGEVLKPEYTTMSRRPGIAAGWYARFKSDVYPSDFLITRGVKVKPPKFFDGLLEREDPLLFRKIKLDRSSRNSHTDADGFDDDDSFRLPVKEQVKLAQISSLSRDLEVTP